MWRRYGQGVLRRLEHRFGMIILQKALRRLMRHSPRGDPLATKLVPDKIVERHMWLVEPESPQICHIVAAGVAVSIAVQQDTRSVCQPIRRHAVDRESVNEV